MYGAIIGDIVGSVYERANIKHKDFELFKNECRFTDDSVMTIAVADALLVHKLVDCELRDVLIKKLKYYGRLYPSAGYGGRFSSWLFSDSEKPYNSYGNGAAMRVSPCGLMALSLSEAMKNAEISAAITHNHPQGIKGARAVAGAVFLASNNGSKADIKAFVEKFYKLDKCVDEIREAYTFDLSCQGTVPEAVTAFLESNDFEDTIRTAISLGGDSDTLAAIACSIAYPYYTRGYDSDEYKLRQALSIRDEAVSYLDRRLLKVICRFNSYVNNQY